jgi:phage baseplate assembly protein W
MAGQTPTVGSDVMGTDLVVAGLLQANDASSLDLSPARTRPIGVLAPNATQAFDLGRVSGRENLAHALLLRLLTPLGSLAGLGHAGYGSRLHLLIGGHKTEATRNLCRVYLLEAVAQEPRVDATAVSVSFARDEETTSSFNASLQVRPVDGTETVGLSLAVGI